MRNSLIKFAGIILALVLALTGCSLIEIDPVMQADEDMEEARKAYSTVIATYDGGQITKFDVMYDYTYTFNMQYYYMMQLYQYALNEATDGPSILTNVLEANMQAKAIEKLAAERGITLTEEELADCDKQGAEIYQQQYDTHYETAEGDTEEVRVKNTEVALYRAGVTKEKCVETFVANAIYEKTLASITDEITEVTEEDLAMALTEQAIADEGTYSEDLMSFERDMMDAEKFIAWRPNGYRTVKHILVIPEQELLTNVTSARSALNTAKRELTALEDELIALNDDEPDETAEPRTAEEIQADIDAKTAEIETLSADAAAAEAACLASKQPTLNEIYAKLDAGEDFETVMAEYGEDPGMQQEPTMSRGYYVSADSTSWDVSFRDAAMTLESMGDYTAEPIIGTSGIHIILYDTAVVGGQIDLDTCRDEFYEVTLEKTKGDYFDTVVNEATAALHPKYNVSAFFK